jgi:hypothetical protein
MKDLDCNTPKGREHIAQQYAIIERICAAWKCEAILTPDDKDSPVDVLFVRDRNIVAVAEVKSRPTLTLNQLRAFKPPTDGYLITYRKIEEGIQIGWKLRVPYLVIVGMVDALAWWYVSDEHGQITGCFHVQRSETQATCNGGIANRENAYLRLSEMRFVVEQTSVAATTTTAIVTGEVTADDIQWM